MNHTPTHPTPQRGIITQTLIREEQPLFVAPVTESRPRIELTGEIVFYGIAILLMLIGIGYLFFYFWGVLTA